jgi:diguanylate cyclase (GGDEF)-like protein/PAS domain S-box-containing protein
MGEVTEDFKYDWKSKPKSIYHYGILVILYCLSFIPLEYFFHNNLANQTYSIWHLSSGITLLFGIFARPWSTIIIFIVQLISQLLLAGHPISWIVIIQSIFYSIFLSILPVWLLYKLKISLQLRTLQDTAIYIIVVLLTSVLLGLSNLVSVPVYSISGNQAVILFINYFLREFSGILPITYAFLVINDYIKFSISQKHLITNTLRIAGKHLTHISKKVLFELLGFCFLSLIGIILLVATKEKDNLEIFLLSILPMLWLAILFGRPGSVISLLVMAIIIGITEKSFGVHIDEAVEYQVVLLLFLPITIILGTFITGQQSIDTLLQESKGKFKILAEAAPIGICQLDRQLNLNYFNHKWMELTGYSLDELQKKAFLEMIHIDDRMIIQQLIENASLNQNGFNYSFRIIPLAGQSIWVEGNFSILTSSLPKDTGILCAITDITSYKDREGKIKKNEELLSSFINNLPDAAWLKDCDGRYLAVNRMMEQIHNLNQKEFIGKKDSELFGIGEAELYRKTDQIVIQSKVPLRFESQQHPGDDYHWFETVKTPIFMGNQIIGTTGISRDISDRRNVEIALLESEHRLKGLLNNIPDIAWMKDSQKKYMAVNEVFLTIFDSKSENIVGKSSSELFLSEIVKFLDENDDDVLALGQPKVFEEILQSKENSNTWFETIKMPLFDEQQTIVGLTGVARDITTRKHSEDANNQQLERERLISSVSFRLNGISRSIKNDEIQSILNEIGTYLGADRCIFIIYMDKEGAIEDPFQWVRTGVEKRAHIFIDKSWNGYQWFQDRIDSNLIIRVGSNENIPSEAISELAFVTEAGIKSLLYIPIKYHDTHLGSLIGVETITSEHKWSESDEQLLRVISEMITTTISRLKSDERLQLAESRYRMLVEQISAVVYIDSIDQLSSTIYMSPQIKDITGYTAEEMTLDPTLFWKTIHPDDRDRVMRENERTNLTEEPFQIEYRLVNKNGEIVWVEDRAFLFIDESGEKRWHGVIYNISHRKQIEEALFESEARFHELFEHSPIALWEEDFTKVKRRIDQLKRQGVEDLREYLNIHPKEISNLVGMVEIIDANQATLTLTKTYTKKELIENHKFSRQLKPDELFIEEMVKLAQGETHFEVEGANDIQDGEVRFHNVHVMVVPGHEALFDRLIIAVTDITERKTTEDQLVFLSTHDGLTGLYSRSYFETEMARLQVSRQYPISIMMADADHLKETNDREGHAAGDKLIIRTAQVLRMTFRPEDVVARIGGDEFAVLIPRTDSEAAQKLVDRLNHMIQMENLSAGPLRSLELSIGIATADEGDSLNDILKEADRMMYEDKLTHHSRA